MRQALNSSGPSAPPWSCRRPKAGVHKGRCGDQAGTKAGRGAQVTCRGWGKGTHGGGKHRVRGDVDKVMARAGQLEGRGWPGGQSEQGWELRGAGSRLESQDSWEGRGELSSPPGFGVGERGLHPLLLGSCLTPRAHATHRKQADDTSGPAGPGANWCSGPL